MYKIDFDKGRYIYPLDEYGEVVYVKPVDVGTLYYWERVDNYLNNLSIDKEEMDLKRSFFSLDFVRPLVYFSSASIVDSYAFSSTTIQAMQDLYRKSAKGNKRKEEDAFHHYHEFNDSQIMEAQKARAIFNEAISKYGVLRGETVNDKHMNRRRFDVICYMRDHGVSPSWAAYFTDTGDQQAVILKIYNGFVYEAFLE